MSEVVQSPCRSLCNLGQDKVCRGCFRTSSEITYWTTYSNDTKTEVVERALKRERHYLESFGGEPEKDRL